MKPCIIVDIDGTIANNRWREHLIPKKDDADQTHGWEVFNKACVGDSPIHNVIHDVMKRAAHLNCPIIYITGRGASAEPETRLWLNLFSPGQGELIMRPMGDHRKAADFKLDAVIDLQKSGWEIKEAWDDDPTIVNDVFRMLGTPVTHVKHDGAEILFYEAEEVYRE